MILLVAVAVILGLLVFFYLFSFERYSICISLASDLLRNGQPGVEVKRSDYRMI